MAAAESGRVAVFVLLCTLPIILSQGYEIPDVSIVALKPRGIWISIPDNPNIILFAFQGRINRQIGDDDVGEISAEVLKPTNGRWTYQNNQISLKVGDIIYYYVHVIKDRQGYHKSQLKHTIRELYDPHQPSQPAPSSIPTPVTEAPVPVSRVTVPDTSVPQTSVPQTSVPNTACRPTVTTVLPSGALKSVCSGQIIFEDYFDTLNEDLWTIEQYIPSKPEYPFVSYQRPPNGPTVIVENGVLRIEPKLQENLPGFDSSSITYSTLDLSSGCTRPESCVFTSDGGHILTPIASGRLTSKSFAFKYGFIEVRAKFPQGDWLYPDILLESLFKYYGADNYASGVLRIAGALGNILLTKGTQDFGNKVLYGGPMMDFKCRENLLVKKFSNKEWGNDFHTYSLRWAPEMIALFVDGEEWGRVEPPASGLKTRLPRDTCNPPRTFLKTPMAPFDDYFSIILGVTAGGVSEFPDGVISQYTIPKPWRNAARRARLNFFNAKSTWLPTWTQPALLIDYVTVISLSGRGYL